MRRMSLQAHESLPKDWERTQYVAFRSFINHTMKRDVVDELERDLNDGVVLYKLLETLAPGSMQGVKIVDPPPNDFQRLANCEAVIAGISSVVHLTNFGGRDLWEGNLKLIMGLLWSLIYRFRIAKQQDEAGQNETPKNFFIQKLRDAVEPFASIEMPTNLTEDLKDGRVLAALLHSFNPHVVDPESPPGADATETIELLQMHFEALGVPSIISAQDIAQGVADEKATLLYISYLHEAFSRADEQIEVEAEKDDHDREMTAAIAAVPQLANMTEEQMKIMFQNPKILELMCAVQTQFAVIGAQYEKSAFARGSRTGMMQQMLAAGQLPRAQQQRVLAQCAQHGCGVATQSQCNVCAGPFVGDGSTCFGCGLRVHPTCLSGMKPVMGHLLRVALCILCTQSERAVPLDGYGWQPKETVVRCSCGKEFGIARWKHRCRSCGAVRCDACCSRKCIVPGFLKPERVCLSCFDDLPKIWRPSNVSNARGSRRGSKRGPPLHTFLSPRSTTDTLEEICTLPGTAICSVGSKDNNLFYVGLSDEVFVFQGSSWTTQSLEGTLSSLCLDGVSGCVWSGGTHVTSLYPQIKTIVENVVVSCICVDGDRLVCGHPEGQVTEYLFDGSLAASFEFDGAVICLTEHHVATTKGVYKRSTPGEQVHRGAARAMVTVGDHLWVSTRDQPEIIVLSDTAEAKAIAVETRVRCLVASSGFVYGGSDGLITCWKADTMEKTAEYPVKGVVRGIAFSGAEDDREIMFVADKTVGRVKLSD